MNEPRFTHKNVVVIGGNSGIGLASAKRFAEEGARVAIVGRNAKTLAAAQQEIGNNTLAICGDISTLGEIDRIVNELKTHMPSVDALFANAGVGAMAPFAQVSEDMWDNVMNINLKGLYFSVQKILPLMHKGSAVVLCSSVGAVRSWPGSSVYSASKAGLNAISRALAAELVSEGIRVNVVMPGGVDTPIMGRTVPAELVDDVKQGMASHAPMQRLADPNEIANAVLFLASADAAYMTGSEMIVDGGVVGCAS